MTNSQPLSILITGGTSGLGLELVRYALELGHTVHTISRNQNSVELIEHENLKFHTCDLTNSEDLKKTINEIEKLDVLINNAGIWLEGDLGSHTDDQIDDVITTNLTSLIKCTKYCIPLILQSDKPHIINISSTSGITPRPDQTVYAASKWGVRGFTDSLKEFFKTAKVKVIGIYPGGMKTPLFEKAGFKKEISDFMDPKDVAKIVIDLLNQPNNLSTDHVVISKKVYGIT